MMTASVAMAAYNGEAFIAEQIESILQQLRKDDELVISLNISNDNTENIIRRYAENDYRVKIHICEDKGVLQNFENAISHCIKDIIFLSDQDDIWEDGKLSEQIRYFEDNKIYGVCHSCVYIDSAGQLLNNQPKTHKRKYIKPWNIIIQNPVQGSCLAFRKEIVEKILPFPKQIPMHDSWIGINICRFGELVYVDKALLRYRQHSCSVTSRKHKPILNMINDRFMLIYCYYKASFIKAGDHHI